MSSVRTSLFRWFHIGLACLAAWTAASPALAQVKDVPGYPVTVSKDKADLRCGESVNFYKVLELKAGTVLQVDGEAGDFARVNYPKENGIAYVKGEFVTYDAPAKEATLTQANSLLALNPTIITSSWKKLLAQPLPIGTKLRVLDEAKDPEGRVIGYKIAPPPAARGFVRKADIRPATPAEIAAVRATASVVTAPSAAPPVAPPANEVEAPRPGKTSDTPQPGNTPPNVKDQPNVVTPTAPPTTPPAATGDNSLLEPMVKPGDTPAEPPVTPAVATPATPPAAKPEPTAPPAPKAITLNDLERSFDIIRRQSPDDAEYPALIAEYQRFQAALPAESRRNKQLQGRIDWLNMRIEVRENQRTIEDMKRQADSQGREVGTKLADLERQRQYAIVGRLLPSNVYDGTNLPLMYRLQTVTGGMGSRTVGYIAPRPELDLPSKLNQVVGVIGEIKMDPAMSLNMITAQRIDILQAADGGPARNP